MSIAPLGKPLDFQWDGDLDAYKRVEWDNLYRRTEWDKLIQQVNPVIVTVNREEEKLTNNLQTEVVEPKEYWGVWYKGYSQYPTLRETEKEARDVAQNWARGTEGRVAHLFKVTPVARVTADLKWATKKPARKAAKTRRRKAKVKAASK